MVHSLNKGKNGEREAGLWLQQAFNLSVTPYRNLDQTREGGFDLMGFPPLAIEVKRQETLNKKNWWIQVKNAINTEYSCACVMYRQNRQPWRFLLPAELIGVKRGYIELQEREFKVWVRTTVLGQVQTR